MAATFGAQVDKEMTVFTGSVHRDNWRRLARHRPAPAPRRPASARRTSGASRTPRRTPSPRTSSPTTRRSSARSASRPSSSPARPTAHPALGTLAGIDAITLDDVKAFWKAAYTRAALTVGLAGDVPADLKARFLARLGELPAGPALPAPAGREGPRAPGPRGRDRPEGDAGDGDLVRPADRRHPLAPRLRRPLRRPRLARRAPLVACRTSTSGSASCAA